MASLGDDEIERFKRATVSTARALARENEMEVMFGDGQPGVRQKRARLPLPPRDMPAHARALVRGSADSAALYLRHHSEDVYRKHQPAGDTARLVYDALEMARCEAIGANDMPGIAENISAILHDRARRLGYHEANERSLVGLNDALRFMAHEILSHGKLPRDAKHALDLWKPFIEQRIGPHLGNLPKLLMNQEAYAAEVRRILRELNMDFPGSPEDDSAPGEQNPEDNTPQESEQEESSEAESQSQSDKAEGLSETPQAVQEVIGETEEGDDPVSGDAEADRGLEDIPDAGEGGASGLTTYNAYTTQFDAVVHAETLAPSDELARLRLQLDNQLRSYHGVIAKLANRLQRKLLAKQARSWHFDREEGLLDASRLTRIILSPGTSLSYKVEREMEFRDTVVTLLIDNSGSMRGRPITLAAITADILSRTLERCAVKVEILGFTTSAWKGGKSRESWLKAGKPLHPGRLNDLRHIIYKAADAPWRRTRRNLGLMLREGLLKENIDGEALLWAHDRLLRRREDRRILMVISDGAPVDDSTLSVNPGTYLEQHLRQVIHKIENASPVELLAIGIGHDVTRYYQNAVTLTDAEQLGGTVLGQLAELFEKR